MDEGWPNVSVLGRPLYSFAEVDELARLKSGTARRWLEGYKRRNVSYPPLLRESATGSQVATWGEFVEADLVGRYRQRGVSLLNLRPVIMDLREKLGTPYPLALERPLTMDRALVRSLQESANLDRSLELVLQNLGTKQLYLAPMVENWVKSIEYEDDAAVRLHPDGRTSAVQIDPLRAFGRPTVRAVRTERLSEAFRAGDSMENLAAIYELTLQDVEAAIRFEVRAAA